MSLRSATVILSILGIMLSGCSVSLAGLVALDERRERSAATVGPEGFETFEEGAEVEVLLTDGTEFDAEFAGLETEESGRVVVFSRSGNPMRVAPDSIVWIRPRQNSYIIHAFAFGAIIDVLAIVLFEPANVGPAFDFGF